MKLMRFWPQNLLRMWHNLFFFLWKKFTYAALHSNPRDEYIWLTRFQWFNSVLHSSGMWNTVSRFGMYRVTVFTVFELMLLAMRFCRLRWGVCFFIPNKQLLINSRNLNWKMQRYCGGVDFSASLERFVLLGLWKCSV